MTRMARLAGICVSMKVYMRSKTKVLTPCAAALVVWALAGQAWTREPDQQAAQQSDQQAPTIKSEVSLVNVFATVRDRKKHIVPDLKTGSRILLRGKNSSDHPGVAD